MILSSDIKLFDLKAVKIKDISYWDDPTNNGYVGEVTVDGVIFKTGLDNKFDESIMRTYFGKIVDVKIYMSKDNSLMFTINEDDYNFTWDIHVIEGYREIKKLLPYII
jgi:hypothetical protein